jgi:hypothetical protein
MAFDWKGILGGIAPTLATALGGPAAGLAVKAISAKLLGHENGTPEEVAAAIAGATPEQIESLKKLDQEFTLSLVDKATALEQIESADRADARKREIDTHDLTTRVLAYCVLAFFGIQMWLLTQHAIPNENRDAANQLVGVLYMAVGNVLGYYFGTSSGSKAKDAVIGRIASQK